ncbi:MAG: hypothetical protein V4722_01395 [Bacteroidota bacterium]
MKTKHAFYSIVLSLAVSAANAQTPIPEGYVKATITLANNSELHGYIKDNMKKAASVSFLDESGNNKKNYDGNQINSLTIEGANLICLNGDFFKSVCTGKLNFLQKLSDASGKLTYNGSEPIFNNGTEGKIGDYFVYSSTDRKLKLLNKKSVDAFIANDLTGCTEAIEKAKTINGDIAQLKGAVEIYNSYASK